MSWVDHIQGKWAADDLRRAFVMGAEWWEFHKEGATMWNSDIDLVEAEAEKIFPHGGIPTSDNQKIHSTEKSERS